MIKIKTRRVSAPGRLKCSPPFCFQVTALVQRKLFSREERRKLIKNILQSSLFLSYNAFYFVFFICAIR